MCECLLFDCLWCNVCGHYAGCSNMNCCIGIWCCKPDDMERLSPGWCYCCEYTGCGANCLWWGAIAFAPEWLRNYQKARSPITE